VEDDVDDIERREFSSHSVDSGAGDSAFGGSGLSG
jgi:hypothetical protein